MSAPSPYVVLFAGVGGQGALSAARFLGQAGHRLGLPLTVSQLHGMSQRGGAVQASVSFGSEGVASLGGAAVDVLVGLELFESLRMLQRVDGRTTVLCNRRMLPPPVTSLTGAKLPSEEEILGALRKRAQAVHLVDAQALSEQAGAAAATNTVMLGALLALRSCPVDPATLLQTMREASSPEVARINERALQLGQQALLDRPVRPD